MAWFATQVGEDLEFELAGEFSHAGGKVGAHQLGGVGEVASVCCEGGAGAVAEVGGGVVVAIASRRVGLDVVVVGGVAADEAGEVAEYLLRQTLRERGGLW
jgi:sugar/nucleoside kinase (ribokinase family)